MYRSALWWAYDTESMAKHTLKQMELNPRAHSGAPTAAHAPSLYLSISLSCDGSKRVALPPRARQTIHGHQRKARQAIHASVLGPALPAWTRGPCTRRLDTQRYLIKVSYLTYPWSMYSMARYIKGSSQKASKNSTKLGQIPPANIAHATWRHSKWSAWRQHDKDIKGRRGRPSMVCTEATTPWPAWRQHDKRSGIEVT